MTSIELITPWGDTVTLKNTGQFNVDKFGDYCPDRFTRIYQIGNWLNLEWYPMVFEPNWYYLRVEDISELPEKI